MAISRVLGLSGILVAQAVGAAVGCSHAPLVVASLPPEASAAPAAPVDPAPPTAPRMDPKLLPRKVLFGQPDRTNVMISPDGARIGWLGPVRGVMNVFVGPADDVRKARAITRNTGDDIRSWWWAGSDRVLFTNDKDGDDSVHLFSVDVAKAETKDLAPIDGVHAEIVALSPKRPHEAIVSLNERDRKLHDAYLVDLVTGSRKLVEQNDGTITGWVGDEDLRVRFAKRENPDGSVDWLEHGPAGAAAGQKWSTFQHVEFEDALGVSAAGFDKTSGELYLRDSRGRDTSALFSVDTKSGAATMLADDPHADAGQVLVHPVNKTIEAVLFDYDRPTWKVIDASVEGDFYYLRTFGDGEIRDHEPLDRRAALAGRIHPQRRADALLPLRPRPRHPRQPGQGHVPLRGTGHARARPPRDHLPGGHQVARRARSRQLPDDPHRGRHARRGPARPAHPDGGPRA